MRVVESAGFYYPDSLGGTEVYVSSLVKGLQAQGIECVVAAPTHSNEAARYVHDGSEVFRYPVPEHWLRRETRNLTPHRDFQIFEGWLRKQRADIYHQHSWTTACGIWHLEAAKQLGLKTVVTVHLPTNVCLRGTMLFEGRTACDGEILPERCASCWLQSKGIPASAARRLAALPEAFAPLTRLPRIGPALAARAITASHMQQLQDMSAAANRVVAVCGWLYEALHANGVSPAKLVLNRQGVRAWPSFEPLNKPNGALDTVRVGFLGRWDPVKGIHILVDAFKRLPAKLPIALDIRAAGGEGEKAAYRRDVQASAAGDRRIHFLSTTPHAEVGAFLAGLDILAVPSQWLETGPLVVLEAFAAGTPVIGSDLGGIKELVSHERDGLLVAHGNVSDWTAALLRLATDRALLGRLSQGIGSVRTMSDVAHDTAAMYRELLGHAA
jgi:glycosyltransferase involved in cell wall biosynthesis